MLNKIRGLAFLGAGLMAFSVSQAQLSPYGQSFEGLDPADPEALTNDGWLIFGNVFAGDGAYKFGYGNTAPNGGNGFSALVTDQGGASQELVQLSVYNDYDCCGPGSTDEGHFNGTDIVESNVFQEQTIGAENVGETWTFSFDGKRGDIGLDATAQAFIKTLNPAAGFATTNFVTVEMTTAPDTWNRYELSLLIDDTLPGQLLQIGFVSTASNFDPSGIFYDNIDFAGPVDTDGDGVTDSADNCTLAANADQADADGDGFGNACDADFDNSCFTTFPDLAVMEASFFTPDPLTDLDGSGFTTFPDLAIMEGLFFLPPGPSGVPNACD